MSVQATTQQDLYPSRAGGDAYVIPRRDPILHGEETGALSWHERKSYEANGFLTFESLFSHDELAAWQVESKHLRQAPELRDAPERVSEPDSDITRSIFGVHRHAFESLARHPRLLAIVQELLGGDVYIHQSRINYKPGFRGREFYWHSDFETWHVEDGLPRMRTISASVNLTANSEFNGPLMVIPGSHQHYVSCTGGTPDRNFEKSLRQQVHGTPDEDSLAWLADQGGIVAPKGPPGSVMLFECNIMHGSSSNICPWPRTNVFLVYNSVHNGLVDPYCGLEPRPEHVGNRTDHAPLTPI